MSLSEVARVELSHRLQDSFQLSMGQRKQLSSLLCYKEFKGLDFMLRKENRITKVFFMLAKSIIF